MHDMTQLRDAIIVWAAGREGSEAAGEVVRELVGAARTLGLANVPRPLDELLAYA